MRVILDGRTIDATRLTRIGEGGEAEVFALPGGRALKLFKPPTHSDFAGDPALQDAVRGRLEEHQRKLRALPPKMPGRFAGPQALATSSHDPDRIVGYAMRQVSGADLLLRYGEKSFREGRIPATVVARVFLDLHRSLSDAHKSGIVVGDLNDLNVLVKGTEAHLIDVDSYQWGTFLCRVFTERYLDPMLLDPAGGALQPTRPFTMDSDWYAFAALLLRSLLYVDAYGGMHKPPKGRKPFSREERALRRLSVLHAEIGYPKPALPPDRLPDDLLQQFVEMFERDRRGEFPTDLLQNFEWSKCPDCGTEHGRALCPVCARATATPARVREVERIRGNVRARRLLETPMTVLDAALDAAGHLVWVAIDRKNGQAVLRREDGTVLCSAPEGPFTARVAGRRTILAGAAGVFHYPGGGTAPRRVPAEQGLLGPTAALSSTGVAWEREGALVREGPLGFGTEHVGDVVAGASWVAADPAGSRGIGFTRAGDYRLAFLFDTTRGRLRTGIAAPPIRGQLVAAAAAFSPGTGGWIWLATATRIGGRTVRHVRALRPDGSLIGAADDNGAAEPATWWRGLHHAAAAGRFLFVPTEAGVVRLEPDEASAHISVSAEFPDTEPFVDSSDRLLAGPDGLYVVSAHEITHLSFIAAAARP